MSKERWLLQRVFSNWGYPRDIDLLKEIRELLAQPEQDKKAKVDFETLNELGLKRLQVSDTLVLQESSAISPTLIFSENGDVIEIIGYKKILEIKRFVDELLAQPEQDYITSYYEDLRTVPPTRNPLSEQVIAEQAVWATNSKHSFKEGVRWAEQQHGIGL